MGGKKRQNNCFSRPRRFCAWKIVAYIVFRLLVFLLLLGFGLICVFVSLIFFGRKISRFEILKYTPINPPIENYFLRTQHQLFFITFKHFYYWEFLFIYDNLWKSFFNHNHLLKISFIWVYLILIVRIFDYL